MITREAELNERRIQYENTVAAILTVAICAGRTVTTDDAITEWGRTVQKIRLADTTNPTA